MRIAIGANSIKGKREIQQDNFGFMQVDDIAFFVICDGNGGIGGGELSRIAVNSAISAFLEFFKAEETTVVPEGYIKAEGLKVIRKAIMEVMFEKSCREYDKAGTTITVIILTPYYIGTFWVGDSPACLYRQGKIEQLIIPHTLAEELIKNHGQSRELISQQPSVNSVITRCAGHLPCEPEANIKETPDSCFIIAGSDGLFGFLENEEIVRIMQANVDTQKVVDELVRQSYANGSDDNITVVAARYSRECKDKLNNRLTDID